MRLLLIILACLATCLCLPHTKQRRGILPGDPRYGTEHTDDHHHHHHDNTIVDVKSINGHYDSTPLPLNEAYGPPGFHPGVPLNDYLPPVIDKYSTPLPPYEAHGVVGVPHGLNGIVEPNNIHIQKTVIPTTAPVIVEKTEGVIGTVPTTSYGVPIDTNIKTIVKSAAHTHIKTIGTTNAAISTPALKVVEHAPVVQGLPGLVNGITTVPAVSTIGTKNVIGDTLLNGGWLNGQTAYGGSYIPGYDVYSQIPTSFYSGLSFPFDTTSSGFAGIGLNRGVYAPQSLPLSAYPFPHTLQVPRTTLQVPYSLPHLAQHPEPVHTLESLPPVTSLNTFPSVEAVQSVESFTPVHPVHPVTNLPPVLPVHPVTSLPPVHPVHPVTSFPPVHPVHPVTSLPPVHTVHSAGSVTTVGPVHPVETLTPVPPIHSAKILPPVHTVHSVDTFAPIHAVHSVKSLPPVEPVHSVHALTPVHPLHSVKSLPLVEPVHSVETLTPVHPIHSVKTLTPVESVHSVSTLPPLHAVHSVKSLPPVESVHSVGTLPPFHGLHSVKSLPPVEPLHSVDTLTPLHALHSVHSLPPVETVHSVDTLTPLHAGHSVKSLTPLPALHSIDNLHPVHSLHTVESVRTTDFPLGAPVHSVGAVTTSHPFEKEHAVTEVVKTHTLPIIDKHVRAGTPRGPFDDFLQNLGSFLPQFPQLPQFPSLPDFGSVSTTGAPAVEISSPSSHLLTESINKDSVTVEAPVLPTEHLVKNVVTTANEYVQPTNANGGYIY